MDPTTGMVEILRYVVSEDCGRMINPNIVEGQVHGGVAQGIGGVLYEHNVYDDDGNPLASTFLDYLVPTAARDPRDRDVPHRDTGIDRRAATRASARAGRSGRRPAVFNAIADALAQHGIVALDQPLDPDTVLGKIRAAGH